MKRRDFLIAGSCGLALVLGGQAAYAQTAQDQVIRQLKTLGYTSIRVRRTLLGRVRILAQGRPGSREIVLDPATGTILRDYSVLPQDSRDRGTSSASGGSRDDDSKTDDDKDDDDKDDQDDDHDDDNDDNDDGDDDDD
ncbi:hypothetical protein [Tropicibacter oceani]|uniref:PepSY domain-containing protein n=1 Tax=Tropicibacter oceani TaxID=3058420 RepID=A0ABY8QLZ8_9RHOB|nr:hypothetical protein [Tropicibacter oceani]WGW05670.1 hypothetical protein QF118_09030 [Tropicibacter oceani]